MMVNGSCQSGRGILRTTWVVQLVGHTPGQEIVDAIDFVTVDMGSHVVEVGTRINVIQSARANQCVLRGCPFATAV